MPEGDTIFRAAHTLHRALSGEKVTGFESVFPRLTRVDFDSGVTGRTVEKVEAHGKWMCMHFCGDLILLTHMLMNGSWHIYRPGEKWQRRSADMRIVLKTARIWAIAFNAQVAEFHTRHTLRRREGFRSLGPDILSAEFDPAQAAANLRANARMEVGTALLAQSILAGLGNVYKSEVCFACGVNPFRRVQMLREDEVNSLVTAARKFLAANVSVNPGERSDFAIGARRTTGRSRIEESLWVYGRTGEPCRRCGAAIESWKQGTDARTTFWCPHCQPALPSEADRAVASS